MKRYVSEFAKDEMGKCTDERKAEIQRVIKWYERGIITSFEAVRAICDSYYDEL